MTAQSVYFDIPLQNSQTPQSSFSSKVAPIQARPQSAAQAHRQMFYSAKLPATSPLLSSSFPLNRIRTKKIYSNVAVQPETHSPVLLGMNTPSPSATAGTILPKGPRSTRRGDPVAETGTVLMQAAETRSAVQENERTAITVELQTSIANLMPGGPTHTVEAGASPSPGAEKKPKRALRPIPASMPWTDTDELPVLDSQKLAIRRLIEESKQADEEVPEIKSSTLDALSKFTLIQPANLRYFQRIFERFDQDTKHLLNMEEVRCC